MSAVPFRERHEGEIKNFERGSKDKHTIGKERKPPLYSSTCVGALTDSICRKYGRHVLYNQGRGGSGDSV